MAPSACAYAQGRFHLLCIRHVVRELRAGSRKRRLAEYQGPYAPPHLLPLGDLHAESVLLMRYLLGELAGHRELNALIEKEGVEHPFLPQRFWDEIADPGYRAAASVFNRQLGDRADRSWDCEALACR